MGIRVNPFWIKGDWDVAPTPDGLMTIIMPIPPRRVFGAGWHPSTQAALVALNSHVQSGDNVADIGTGTGILAVAAKKLGADYVFASDIYPRTREATSKLFEVNNVDIEFSMETWPVNKVDLIICSIGDKFVESNKNELLHWGRKVITVNNDSKVEILNG